MSAAQPIRISAQTFPVLEVLLEDPTQQWYGLELMRAASLKSGTLYPILARLESAGWLESRWEDVEPSVVGRPRRRIYRLTSQGTASTHELTTPKAAHDNPRPRLRPSPQLA